MNTIDDKFKDLEDIIEIKELDNFQDVNAHIKHGWKLIDVYKSTAVNQTQTINYCIGRPKSATKANDMHQGINKPDTKNPKKFVYSI